MKSLIEKILITGSSGFIGSHCVESLASTGVQVVGVDLVPCPVEIKGNFTEIVGDLSDSDLLEEALSGIQKVVHLAARPSVPDSWQNPYETIIQNSAISAKLINACFKKSIPIFLASSSSIYGLEGTLQNPFKPISPYGASKAAMEMIFQAYQNQKHLQGGILRFFNVFGPRHRINVDNPPVIAKLLECARLDKEFELHGDGNQSRDFTYVHDLITLIKHVVMSGKSFSDPIELSYNKTISLNDLITVISEITNRQLRIRQISQRVGDIRFSKANGSLNDFLGFLPQHTTLHDSLEQTWKWHLTIS